MYVWKLGVEIVIFSCYNVDKHNIRTSFYKDRQSCFNNVTIEAI